GHDVGDRAACPAELRRVAAAIDLKFLHRIDAELIRRTAGAGAAQGLTVKVVVVVAAVDLQAIEGPAKPAETQVAGPELGGGARGEQEKFEETPPVGSESGDLAVVDGSGDARAGGLDCGGSARALSLGRRRSDRQAQFHGHGLSDA